MIYCIVLFILCYVMLCYVMFMLCYVYIILYYIILCYITIGQNGYCFLDIWLNEFILI